MNCERNQERNCGCGGNQVGGSRDYPCREQLRALERCLQNIDDRRPSRPRPCRCRCCCCCCHHDGRGFGNQTTWGREY